MSDNQETGRPETGDGRAGHVDAVRAAQENPDIPRLYFNGFSSTLGTGDVVIVLSRNGEPVAILNASYTLAKTLAEKLGGLIAVLESQTGADIMTTDVVGESLGSGAE